MELDFRPPVKADFPAFYEACYPNDRNDAGLRAIVQYEWDFLISYPTTFSLIVEDKDRPQGHSLVACAQTAFVTEAFASKLHGGASPWLNVHLTHSGNNGSTVDKDSALLSEKAVREANSHQGLNGVMTRWMVATQLYDEAQALRLRNYLLEWFKVFIKGYKLKEVFVETIGEAASREALQAGFLLLNDYASYYGDTLPQERSRPRLFHFVQEEAWKNPGSLATWIFDYEKPKFIFDFSHGEQILPRWAIAGRADPEIANRLYLTIHAINKRWQNIFKKVEEVAPGLLPSSTAGRDGAGKRGQEKRGVLLRYFKDHPEELCPFDPKHLSY